MDGEFLIDSALKQFQEVTQKPEFFLKYVKFLPLNYVNPFIQNVIYFSAMKRHFQEKLSLT